MKKFDIEKKGIIKIVSNSQKPVSKSLSKKVNGKI